MSSELHRRRLIAAVAVASMLSACSQSPAPPAQASTTPAESTQAQPTAPPPATTPSDNPQKDATVSELLAPSSNATAAGNGAAGASAAGAAPPPATSAPPAAADNAEYATVVSVKKIDGPQQVCTDETVVEKRPQQDPHKVAGTAIGAIAGGLIGSRFGGGSGKTVATVGGAVAGGAIGHKVQENHQDKDTVTRVVKHCRPVEPSEAGRTLYDIVYSYQGQTHQARLDYDPGDRVELPVRSVE